MSNDRNLVLAGNFRRLAEELRRNIKERGIWWDKHYAEEGALLEANRAKAKSEPSGELDRLLAANTYLVEENSLQNAMLVWQSTFPFLYTVPLLLLALADVLPDVDTKKVENLQRALQDVMQQQEAMQDFYAKHMKGLVWAERTQALRPDTEKKWWQWWKR